MGRLVVDAEREVIDVQAPVAGVQTYRYDAAGKSWVGVNDGHDDT